LFVVIDKEHAGETFLDGTPGECADRLQFLSEQGFYVPGGVIESLREERATNA